jgi:hypothetical protein
MTTTLREFSRNLARHRRAAANGHEVLVRDSSGGVYVFKRLDAERKSMADLVGHLAGSVKTGRKTKTLAGYGRA